MKIVIDISDNLMEYIVKGRDLSEEQNDEMALAIANGTPLLENATNRDVINSIFGKNFSIPLATTEEWLDALYEEVNADENSD